MVFFYGTDKRYAYLTSLDLICDQPDSYDLWIKEVGHNDAVSIPNKNTDMCRD